MIASVHHINNKTRQATYKSDIHHILQNKNVMQFAYNERPLLLLGDKKANTIEGYHFAGQYFFSRSLWDVSARLSKVLSLWTKNLIAVSNPERLDSAELKSFSFLIISVME